MSFMASGCFKLPIRYLEKLKAGHQPLHDSSSNVIVKMGFKQRFARAIMAINKFYGDKYLVKLNFSYRKCILKIFVRPNFQFQVFCVCKIETDVSQIFPIFNFI